METDREIIMRHYKQPQGKQLELKDGIAVENTSCGDRYHLHLTIEADHISAVEFSGHGCSVSMASFSLMHDWLQGRSCSEALTLMQTFIKELPSKADLDRKVWGEAAALTAVCKSRSRIRCALMCWEAAVKELS